MSHFHPCPLGVADLTLGLFNHKYTHNMLWIIVNTARLVTFICPIFLYSAATHNVHSIILADVDIWWQRPTLDLLNGLEDRLSFITILSCIHHFGTLLQNGGLVKSTEMICKQGGDHVVRLLMCVCCLCTVRSTIAIKMFFLYCYSASKMIIWLVWVFSLLQWLLASYNLHVDGVISIVNDP